MNVFKKIFFLLLIPTSLIAQYQVPYIQILMSPENKSFDYKVGDETKVRVCVLKNNVPKNNININYSYGIEKMSVEKQGTLKIEKQYKIISIGTLKKPGFKKCKISTVLDGETYSDEITFSFSSELIKPTVNDPKDFDTFWSNAINDMRSADCIVKKTILDEYTTDDVEVSKIQFQVPKSSVNIYGYLSIPKKRGKYPILMNFPGAGIRASAPFGLYTSSKFISLAMEIHGIDPQADPNVYQDIYNAFIGYRNYGVEDKNSYYFKHVILGCIKAADYVSGLTEFDGKNFVAYGGSQGGFLSAATAALHNKVSCLVCFHPAMSDLTGYLHNRAGGWPHMLANKSFNSPNIINTLSYFDTVNFAKRLKVPGFYSYGYNDNTCPPTTICAVINSIKAEKTLFITPTIGHTRIPEMDRKAREWVQEQFKSEIF